MKNKGNKGKLKKTFYIDYQLYTIFYFLLFIGFCSGSRYLIRIRHLRGFHSWVPFSFIHQLVPVYTMVYTNANHISIRLNICQIQCGKVQHIKKNSLNLQKIEAIEISLKKSLYSHSIVALGFGDIS